MTPVVPESLSAAGAAGGGGSSMLLFGFMLLLIIGMFWFSSRTRKKQQEKLKSQQRAMEPGMEVMTSYGLYGRLVSKDEDAVKAVIEIAPGTQVTVHLQTLTNVVERDTPAAGGTDAAGSTAAGDASADETPAGDPKDPRDPGADSSR